MRLFKRSVRWLAAVALVATSPVWLIPFLPYYAWRHGTKSMLALGFGWRLVSVMSVPQDLWRFHAGGGQWTT